MNAARNTLPPQFALVAVLLLLILAAAIRG